MLTLRRVEGREFDPRPGQYSRMSFSSDQVTGTVFLDLNMPFLPNSKFNKNIVLVGKQKLQSISTFLYNIEVANHVKKTAIPAIYYYILMHVTTCPGCCYNLPRIGASCDTPTRLI